MADSAVIAAKYLTLGEKFADSGQWPCPYTHLDRQVCVIEHAGKMSVEFGFMRWLSLRPAERALGQCQIVPQGRHDVATSATRGSRIKRHQALKGRHKIILA